MIPIVNKHMFMIPKDTNESKQHFSYLKIIPTESIVKQIFSYKHNSFQYDTNL